MPDMMDRMMDTNDWDATVVLLWVVLLAVAVAVVLLAYNGGRPSTRFLRGRRRS
ncbi:MAG: hypothetical protein M3357_16615 [Actinomycetota bacterium]|nr:hypothetical protein [Actinomycetota bacterium]